MGEPYYDYQRNVRSIRYCYHFKKEQLNTDGDVYQTRKNRKAKFEKYCYLWRNQFTWRMKVIRQLMPIDVLGANSTKRETLVDLSCLSSNILTKQEFQVKKKDVTGQQRWLPSNHSDAQYRRLWAENLQLQNYSSGQRHDKNQFSIPKFCCGEPIYQILILSWNGVVP